MKVKKISLLIMMLCSTVLFAQDQDARIKVLQEHYSYILEEINSKIDELKEKDENKKDITKDLEYSFSKTKEIIKEIFDIKGVVYKENKGIITSKIGEIEYFSIEPTGSSYLNRLAKFVDRFGVKLVFSQKELSCAKSNAVFDPKTAFLFIGYQVATFKNKDISTNIHEIIHVFYGAMFTAGFDSDFIGYLESKTGSINIEYGEDYDDHVAVEEIAAFSENIAFAARDVYREFLKFYVIFIPEIKEIENILAQKIEGAPYDTNLQTLYNQLMDIVVSFIFTSKYSNGRDEKLYAKAAEYFGQDKVLYQNFLDKVNALYDKEDMLDKIIDVELKDFKNETIKKMISPLLSSIHRLYENNLIQINITSKLKDALRDMHFAMKNHDYIIVEPGEGFNGAFKFKTNLVIEYLRDRGLLRDCYTVTFTLGDLEYTTIISVNHIHDVSNDGLINSFKNKLNEQLNVINDFNTKASLLEQKILELPLDYTSLNNQTLDASELFLKITDITQRASSIRKDYLDNKGLEIKDWSQIIKLFPVENKNEQQSIKEEKLHISNYEISEAESFLFSSAKASAVNQKDIDILIKYLKFTDARSLTNKSLYLRELLNHHRALMTPEQLSLVDNGPVKGPYYVVTLTHNVNKPEFRRLATKFLGIEPDNIITTTNFAQLCINKIVNEINTRWTKEKKGIPDLLSSDSFVLLLRKNGLMDYLANRITELPVGDDGRHQRMLVLDIFFELVNASPYKLDKNVMDYQEYFKLKNNMKFMLDEMKRTDPKYKEKYTERLFVEKLRALKGIVEVKVVW